MIGMERKQMIVDVLVLPLWKTTMTIQWKTTMVTNDLTEAAQIAAAAIFVVVRLSVWSCVGG